MPSKSFIFSCKTGDISDLKKYLNSVKTLHYFISNEEFEEIVNKGFIICCEYGHLECAQYLYSLRRNIFSMFSKIVNINYNKGTAFFLACNNNHLDVSCWLYSLPNFKFDLYDEKLFGFCCLNNAIGTVKWLYSVEKYLISINLFDDCFKNNCVEIIIWMYDFIHIHLHIKEKAEYLFSYACKNGFLSLAQFIYIKCKPNHLDEQLLVDMIKNNRVDVVKWFYKMLDNVDMTIVNKHDLINYCYENGYVEMLGFLCTVQCINTQKYALLLFNFFCVNGNVEFLSYVYEKNKDIINRENIKYLVFACCLLARFDVVMWLNLCPDLKYCFVDGNDILEYFFACIDPKKYMAKLKCNYNDNDIKILKNIYNMSHKTVIDDRMDLKDWFINTFHIVY